MKTGRKDNIFKFSQSINREKVTGLLIIKLYRMTNGINLVK